MIAAPPAAAPNTRDSREIDVGSDGGTPLGLLGCGDFTQWAPMNASAYARGFAAKNYNASACTRGFAAYFGAGIGANAGGPGIAGTGEVVGSPYFVASWSLAASIVCSAVAESFGFMNTGCP